METEGGAQTIDLRDYRINIANGGKTALKGRGKRITGQVFDPRGNVDAVGGIRQ